MAAFGGFEFYKFGAGGALLFDSIVEVSFFMVSVGLLFCEFSEGLEEVVVLRNDGFGFHAQISDAECPAEEAAKEQYNDDAPENESNQGCHCFHKNFLGPKKWRSGGLDPIKFLQNTDRVKLNMC